MTKCKIGKLSKVEKKDFPKGECFIIVGRSLHILTDQDIRYILKELGKYDRATNTKTNP